MATDRRWYLVAYDLDRRDWRTFRVDRASSVSVIGHTFEPRPLDDPARMVAEAISTAGYAHRAVVLVKAPTEVVVQLIPPYAGVTEPDGIHTKVELGYDDDEWLAGYLIGLGPDFEVIEPLELRRYIAALGGRLRRAHSGAAGSGP